MKKIVFPCDIYEVEPFSYLTGSARFGHTRSNSNRLHAGIDIYFKSDCRHTNVYAIEEGEIQRVAPFFRGSDAIEVKSALGVFRYCEIKPADNPLTLKPWKAGDKVKAGDKLGHAMRVFDTVPIMLHLELYTNTVQGPLTMTTNPPYARRGDIIDPTALIYMLEQRRRNEPKEIRDGSFGHGRKRQDDILQEIWEQEEKPNFFKCILEKMTKGGKK